MCDRALHLNHYFDGLVQQRRNYTANALELCLSCINPSSHNVVEQMGFIVACLIITQYYIQHSNLKRLDTGKVRL